jgi:hypothetical protein
VTAGWTATYLGVATTKDNLGVVCGHPGARGNPKATHALLGSPSLFFFFSIFFFKKIYIIFEVLFIYIFNRFMFFIKLFTIFEVAKHFHKIEGVSFQSSQSVNC